MSSKHPLPKKKVAPAPTPPREEDAPLRPFPPLNICPENDARAEAFISLVQHAGFGLLVEATNLKLEYWTRLDDMSDRKALDAYRREIGAVTPLTLLPRDQHHSFITGYMLGITDSLDIPVQWTTLYANAKRAAVEARPTPTIVTPREGLRLEPTPPTPTQPGDQEENDE